MQRKNGASVAVAQTRRAAAQVSTVVDDAEAARLALARLERAAGTGRLDKDTIALLIGRVESGGHSLVGLLRRIARDLEVDDESPEAPHLRAAGEHARQFVVALRELGSVIQDDGER